MVTGFFFVFEYFALKTMEDAETSDDIFTIDENLPILQRPFSVINFEKENKSQQYVDRAKGMKILITIMTTIVAILSITLPIKNIYKATFLKLHFYNCVSKAAILNLHF